MRTKGAQAAGKVLRAVRDGFFFEFVLADLGKNLFCQIAMMGRKSIPAIALIA